MSKVYEDDNIHEAIEKLAGRSATNFDYLLDDPKTSEELAEVGDLSKAEMAAWARLKKDPKHARRFQPLGSKTKVASDDNIHDALEKVAGWGWPSSYSGQDEKYAREFRRKSDMAHGGPMFGQFKKGYQSRLRKYVAARKRGMSAKDALEKVAKEQPDLVPDRLRRALAGATLLAVPAGVSSLAASALLRNPNKYRAALKSIALWGGAGTLAGQGMPIMKHRNAGRPGFKRATKGQRKGKWVFARENETA